MLIHIATVAGGTIAARHRCFNEATRVWQVD